MTFIITLAHFCEVHGPSIIMCTQSIDTLTEDPSSFYSPNIPQSQLCKSCSLIIPSENTHTTNQDNDEPLNDDSKLPPSTIRTKSADSSTVYLSTQYPTSQNRYSSLRQILMKVFTVETNYDSSKPLVFGDNKVGYSMSLSFKLHDLSARGSERKYSIIVTSNIEKLIYLNYSTILINLKELIKAIDNKLLTVIGNQSKNDNNNDIFLRRLSKIPKLKSLIEILNDKDFFLRLHLWACSLFQELKEEE